MIAPMHTVGVRVLDLPYHLDKSYTYQFPPEIGDAPRKGSFVFVPFGRANKKHPALITEIDPPSDYGQLKPILGLMSEELCLSPDLMALSDFVCERTLCTMGDAVRRIVPAEAFSRAEESYSVVEDAQSAPINMKACAVRDAIRLKGTMTRSQLERAFGEEADEVLQALTKLGVLRAETLIKNAGSATSSVLYPTEEDALILEQPRTPQTQREIYALVSESDGMDRADLLAMGYTGSQIAALIKKGLIREEKSEIYRNPYADFSNVERKEPVLSEEQTRAKAVLYGLCLDGKPHGALLFGVTGSGKTSVVLSLCRSLADEGKTAIVLVPEIALTWQSVSAFAAVFGNRLAVIHSRLAGGERLDTFRRIRRGEVDVVLGTRSAVFAPIPNLGAIVIDEEQEHTYKSEQSPKYHARDVARFRCASENALLLLCSATPSVETYEKAKRGVYTLVELRERYGSAKLPRVILSDTKKNITDPDKTIGEELRREIERNLRAGEQTVLFLNRRGFSSYLSCRLCGEAVKCPHCSVSLTYHKKRGRSRGMLVCHYCGYAREVPSICPSCGSEHIAFGGYGTQKVEAELAELFPDARILRMDADTTKGRFSQDEICERFKNREADILIGTQMVTKGHNFPAVTLVGVVAADNALFLDDYRAGERTFSLITQVVGRAGRGSIPGRAVIQTANPDNPTILLAAKQDFPAFYENEIALRRSLAFPPFCDLFAVNFSGISERAVAALAERFALRFSELAAGAYADCQMVVYGPFDAAVYKINEKFRMKLVVKCRDSKRQRELFAVLLREFGPTVSGELTLGIDVNPTII